MSVGRICTREVHLADGGESVRDAAHRMFERGVGSLLVLDEARRPVGIVTDRDLVVRVLAADRDPASTPVSEAMTTRPMTLSEETSIERALALMRSWGVRRAPVVDAEGRLEGLVTLDDLLSLLAGELHVAAELLERQLPPRPDLLRA